jgi:hypothetical protein
MKIAPRLQAPFATASEVPTGNFLHSKSRRTVGVSEGLERRSREDLSERPLVLHRPQRRVLLLLSASPICSQIRRMYRRSRLPFAWLGVPTQTKDSSVSRIAWSARLQGRRYDFTDICFNDGRLPTVDQIDLRRKRVDSNDFMSIIGEAARRHRPHITQPEDGNFHAVFLLARQG